MFGWFKKQQLPEIIVRFMDTSPNNARWVMGLCKQDKGLFAISLKSMAITDSILADGSIDDLSGIMALEEDRMQQFVEEHAADDLLRDIAHTRRDQLWAADGLIGKRSIELKRQHDLKNKS